MVTTLTAEGSDSRHNSKW